MIDPTRKEMLEFFEQDNSAYDFDAVDMEAAIYWFAYDYHTGKRSNLYEALSMSPYKPGPNEDGPEEGTPVEFLYTELVEEYDHD